MSDETNWSAAREVTGHGSKCMCNLCDAVAMKISDVDLTWRRQFDEALAQRDEFHAEAEHWKNEAGRLYARLCLYEDAAPPQQKRPE